MHKHLFVKIILLCSFLMGQAQKKITPNDLQMLSEWMIGSFSSAEQAAKDTSFFDIRLHMVRIWKERNDGIWLYVEQATAKALSRPYRQRIYHLFIENRKTLVSKVFEISTPARFTGCYNKPELFSQINTDSLVDRQGCAIYLKKDASGNFWGATPGKECLSSLRGATYATSEVSIYPDKMISWDRGWDANDKQVWGAVKSGYVFVKQKE